MIGAPLRGLPLPAALLPLAAQAQPARLVEPFDELSAVVVSLLAVVGLILAAAWLLRRTPLGAATRRAGPLQILATLPLGPKERLVLVRAGGEALLIGVSPAGIFALNHRADGDACAADGGIAPAPDGLDQDAFPHAIEVAARGRVPREIR
jgi:flagellar protein FliO/FliZ